MPFPKTLPVKHATRYCEPLVCFTNLPGYDAELTPTQIRKLAAAMLQAADDCETLFKQTRQYGPVRREYPLEQSTSTARS